MKKLKIGDGVLLHCTYEQNYEGTVEDILFKKIILNNIVWKNVNIKFKKPKSFNNEIVKKISIISSFDSEISSIIPQKRRLHEDEYNRLQQVASNFVYIYEFGTLFEKAVEVLNNTKSVGVAKLGNPINLLIMADFGNVYIFDLYCLWDINKLKNILESENIEKVLHDGRELFMCLYQEYGVKMKNIFDTQILTIPG